MVSLALDPPPSREHSNGPRRFGLTLFVVVVAAAAFVAGRWTAPGGRFPVTWSKGSTPAAAVPAAQAGSPPAPGVPAGGVAPADARPAPAVPGAAPSAIPTSAAIPPPAPAAEPPSASGLAGPRRVVAILKGPLEASIAAAMPAPDRVFASELTQVVNRLLVWDLQVARDGLKGDRLELIYFPPTGGSEPGGGEPVVEALRYDSQKLSQVIAAYRWRAPGTRWHRYYKPDGSELEERLVDSPAQEYDQITSLLRDGRRHKGVDFRTPVGTPVFATFDGVIERRNWNFAGNGNCLDVRDAASGRHAIYLHLDVLPADMLPGRRVKKGERIASSGNSGHSFAPHLHYQLESPGGRVLDPFEAQPVHRVALEAPSRSAFDEERTRLDAVLSGTSVASAGGTRPGP